METDRRTRLQEELDKWHIEHQKELMLSARATLRAQSKLDMLRAVMEDVNTVHQGIDSSIRVLVDPDLMLGTKEWGIMCNDLMKRSRLLRELVDCAMELLRYEDMTAVPCEDNVVVNFFCKEMLVDCERSLNNKQVEFSLETSLNDNYLIKTHIGYLHKLLHQLLICSMEYTTEGFIKIKVVEDEKSDRLRFVISDTGVGIPEDLCEHVFDKLPKEDIRNKVAGVRLRMCRALVHLLGGNIYVDTHYTPGTSIVFTVAKN